MLTQNTFQAVVVYFLDVHELETRHYKRQTNRLQKNCNGLSR